MRTISISTRNDVKTSVVGNFICFTARKLGPVFIKLIQVMSSRTDIFSQKMINSFSKFRESVPYENKKYILSVLTNTFGKNYEKIFKNFDFVPIGSGGVAQVHKAVLTNGDVVAIKILRPNIENRIHRSIKIAKRICKAFSYPYLIFYGKTFNTQGILNTVELFLMGQADLNQEREHIKKFQASIDNQGFRIKNESQIIVPKVYDEFSSKTVLVMEFVEGIHPSRYHEVNKSPLELAHIIDDVSDIMIMYNGLVHGDLHPGNFFWTLEGKLVLIDFGLVIEISKVDRDSIISFYMAIIDGYYEYATHLCIDRFIKESAKEELSDEAYQRLYQVCYDIICAMGFSGTEGKPKWLEMLTQLLSELEKHHFSIEKKYGEVLLTLISLQGYHYGLDPTFNMIKNARQKKLNASEYLEIPDTVLTHVIGLASYSTALSQGFDYSNAEYAFKANRTFIGKLLDAKPGDKVLDIGCGRGQFLTELQEERGIIPYGITLSRVEAELCQAKGIEALHSSWEDANEFAKKIGLMDHISIIEMDCHMCTLEENKNGLIEIKLDRLFSWCYNLLKPGGKIFIQQLALSEEVFKQEHIATYNEIVETLPFMGFSTFTQMKKAYSPYYDVIELFEGGKEDYLFTCDFFIKKFAEYKEYLDKKIDVRIYDIILSETKLLRSLAENNILSVNRILLRKKEFIDLTATAGSKDSSTGISSPGNGSKVGSRESSSPGNGRKFSSR